MDDVMFSLERSICHLAHYVHVYRDWLSRLSITTVYRDCLPTFDPPNSLPTRCRSILRSTYPLSPYQSPIPRHPTDRRRLAPWSCQRLQG